MRTLLLAGVAALPLALLSVPAAAQAPVPPAGSGPTAPGPSSPLPDGKSTGGDARGGELGAAPAPGGAAAPQSADTMPPPDQLNSRSVETAPPGSKNTERVGAEREPGEATERRAADDKRGPDDAKNADRANSGESKNADQAKGAEGGKREMTAERRQSIKRDVAKARPAVDINFSVSVGVTVPRTVEVHTVPVSVVEVYPQYRGYRYFVLADGRVVIVEPASYEIVTIIVV